MREELEEMFVAIMNSTTDSIDITNQAGFYLLVNDAKAAKRGVSYRQMIGRHISEFMTAEEAERTLADNSRIIESGEPIEDKREEIHYPDGTAAWVSVSKKPFITKTGEKCVVSVSRNVTERHLAEENLKKSEENLKRINEKMMAMLGAAKHDIRNRAIAMVGILRRLINNRHTDVRVAYQELLSLAQIVEKIINEYLQKSFFEKEIPEKNKFDLDTDIIQPILNQFNQLIDDNDIHIDNILGGIPVDEITVTNEEKTVLKIIYLNLIENALRYGGKGIRIAIGYEKLDKFLKLNVYDSGPAILEGDREKIFDQGFTTGTSTTGEGLAKCRELARCHGGDLYYEPASDGHPNFIILWPKQ